MPSDIAALSTLTILSRLNFEHAVETMTADGDFVSDWHNSDNTSSPGARGVGSWTAAVRVT